MSFEEETYSRIEAYLSGELDTDAHREFEQEIAANETLQAEVEKHKFANALIMEQRLLSVKDILQEERIKDSNTSSFSPLTIVVLAVATIGIGTSILFFNQEEKVLSIISQDSIFAQISQQKPSSIHIETDGSVENNKHTTTEQAVVVTHTEEVGFHKHQIQKLEENLHVDDKGVLVVDTTTLIKKKAIIPQEVKSSIEKNTVPVNPCSNTVLQATIKTIPSCSMDATGSILVQDIHGGVKPYYVSLTTLQNESVINGAVAKGYYQAVVTDANGCIQKYPKIELTEKNCPKDYSFNPFYGNEEWNIDAQPFDGDLEIYDKGGVLYFKKYVPASVAYNWNGMGIGNQVVPGYYIFVIKYANGTSQRGSVTIVQ